MHVTPLVWIISFVVVAGLFVFDFYSHVKTPHAPSMRESGFWTAVYVALAVVFGLGVWWVSGGAYAGEFFAGYVTEKSLSVDNLFVFILIMAKFAVPREYQQKVLLLGIVIALVLRGGFIALGSAAINTYSWVFYIFGIFLVFTALKLVKESMGDSDDGGPMAATNPEDRGRLANLAMRILPTTDEYDGDRLITRVDGKRVVTPMLMALIVIGFTDVLFALDSIPAIFGLTQEPYLVFMANALALMGLRQLYFLIGGLLDRLVYLSYGLSLVLAFIGVKLVLHALHENTLGFINGGDPVSVPEISTGLSLAFIAVTLIVTTVASLMRSRSIARRA